MAGPSWQQLLDFLRLTETLDAIAAGSKKANVDIESLRASLEVAARDVPAIRDALDFLEAASETPVVGGINIFRSAALARGARGARLERAAEALRKRVFEGKESLDAVRRDAGRAVAQEVKAQVAKNPDLFGADVAAAVGAVVGFGVAALAQVDVGKLGPEPILGREAPIAYADQIGAVFRKAGAVASAAYDEFEIWRQGVAAEFKVATEFKVVTPPTPTPQPSAPPGPQLGPQPEPKGEGVMRLARTLEAIWHANNPGVPLSAKLRYELDKKGKQILKDGKPVLDRDPKSNALVWEGDDVAFLNQLATFAAYAEVGNAAEVQNLLDLQTKLYETGKFDVRKTGQLFRDSFAVVRQAVAFPPAVQKVWDVWNDSLAQIDDAFRKTRSYNLDILDENISTFEQVTGKSADKDVQRALGLADDGMIAPPSNINPEHKLRQYVKEGIHYLGLSFEGEDPDEVVYGNTLTRTEIINQMYDIWRNPPSYAVKKELSDTSGGFSSGAAKYLADVHMFENRRGAEHARDEQRAFKGMPEDVPGWQPPASHGPPQDVSSWLGTRAGQGLTRADEQRREQEAEAATEAALQRKAEADVLAYAKGDDFVLANVKAIATQWRKSSGVLEDTVQHMKTLDEADLAAEKRIAERREAEDYVVGAKAQQDVIAYAESLPPDSEQRRWLFDNINSLTSAALKSGKVKKTLDDAWEAESRVRDEEKRLSRITWEDLGRLPVQERTLAVYGFYKRNAKGEVVKDTNAINSFYRRSGENTGDWVERAKADLRVRLADLPSIPGATSAQLVAAGIRETKDENQAFAEMYRGGALGAKALSPSDEDLFSDYRTMVEFQARQVAPNQQEAYRNAAYDKWPQIIATIDARLGVPKAKGDPAEILAEEAYRKQQAAEMIRQTDVPAMVGARKIPDFDTERQMSETFFAQMKEVPRAQLPIQEIQKREAALSKSFQEAAETPAVQRVIAGEAALREGADPQAVTSAIAWEAAQAAQRWQVQYEAQKQYEQQIYLGQEDERRRKAGLPTRAEEQERQVVKPQPFRPTFWRFGPSFGRR